MYTYVYKNLYEPHLKQTKKSIPHTTIWENLIERKTPKKEIIINYKIHNWQWQKQNIHIILLSCVQTCTRTFKSLLIWYFFTNCVFFFWSPTIGQLRKGSAAESVVGQHVVECVAQFVRTLLDLELLAIDLVLDVVDPLIQLCDVHLSVLVSKQNDSLSLCFFVLIILTQNINPSSFT